MQLYVPHPDNGGRDLTLVVRSGGRTGTAGIAALIRDAVRVADPGVPVDDVMTMDDVLAASAARRRLLAGVSLVFAIGATLLAAIGLYGTVAFSVAQRTQEIGVRLALGATANAVIAHVVADASKLVAVGLAIGLAAAALLARSMAPLLFGTGSMDAPAFIAAPAVLLAVALVASVTPAARATRVSPVVTLRSD
jgi:ABC-type antimicrobial peptide transport system permease subunit